PSRASGACPAPDGSRRDLARRSRRGAIRGPRDRRERHDPAVGLGRGLRPDGGERGARLATRLPASRDRLRAGHDRHAVRARAPPDAGSLDARRLMTFAAPWVLGGLVLAAVPIILHLIARREPPTVVFPATRYLADA